VLQVRAAATDIADSVSKARAEVTRRIRDLGRQGRPKEAINELTNLAKLGIQPDTVAATALVSACTTNRNMDMALNVFDELFGAPLSVVARCAHSADVTSGSDPAQLQGASNTGDEVTRLMQAVLSTLCVRPACNQARIGVTVYREHVHAEEFVEPDDIVFAILLRGLGCTDPPDWTRAAQILSRMRNPFQVPMTTPVYNALLELCANSNDLARAEELLMKMQGDGLVPDKQTEAILGEKRAFRTAMRRVFHQSRVA
jgi:pentatricopeptide repeat protein